MPNALSRLVPWLSPARPTPPPLNVAPPEEKASRAGALIAIESLRRPVWTPRDYAAFAREGYMQNAIVYRSVRMVAEAAASIPLLLYDGDSEIEHHPLLNLIAHPAQQQTATDFFEAWYGYLLVSGNAYAEAVAVDGELRELHVLRPDRMKVIPGPDGWPEAHEYTVNGASVRYAGEVVDGVAPILHLRLFHPANDYYGMSPIEAASTAIDIHNTAAQWNKALLDNSARPSGALVYTGGEGRLTAEQFTRLRDELETGFQGARQAGRPLLLEGGLDWKPLGLSPKDMDFIDAKNSAAREIALALGVPPMLLGIPGDNTFSNYQEAQRAFWRSTVLPLFNRTAKALAGWLAPAWDATLQLRPDLDQIDALTTEREALWARLQGTSFLTDDEKRAAIGYGPMPLEAPTASADFDTPEKDDDKFNPAQLRHPAGNSEGGRWADGGGSGDVHLAGGRGGLRGGRGRPPVTEEEARNLPPEKNPAVREGMARGDRYDDAAEAANRSFRALRKLDPDAPRPKKPFDPDDLSEASTQQLKQYKADAEARIKQLSGTKRTVIYEFADDAPGNVFAKKDRPGTLSGDVNRLGDHERKIANERRADGVDVRVVTPRSEQGKEGRTNDLKFNGQNYEIKESKTKSTDVDLVSKSISGQITDAAGQRPPGQSINVLVDARGVPSMTKSTAIKAMQRAGGRFDDRGNRSVDSITILTPEGRVTTRRQK